MSYDGTLKFDTKLDSSGFKRGLSELGSLAKTGIKALSTAVGAASAAFTAAGGAAVKVGSGFEAGMSQVQAVSGATGAELGALTEKAKEMGAVTKFSAKDSADAFNYMAMAGWKASDMIDGIEGVMNLAAASGEDLATVSDIVTDALTAFGLEAGDSSHFADVLAKAASNSNTNVGMMGNTFKYVAPLAGSLGYSIEDMATAIGLMANAGIKGEMAGTQLRAVLSRMAKPTDAVQEAMDVLGLSLTDSEGRMKTFNQIMKEMRAGFAKLTPEQKATYAAMLGGKEAMSGLLAIINASEEDFSKLSAAISDVDGTAKQMAETMQDNLQGAVEQLRGSAETLGIEFYQSIQEPLKDAALAGVDYLNQLTDAFKSGGLQSAAGKAGEIFAEIAVKAAEAAPKVVNAAVSFLKSFIDGIRKNKGQLIAAAKEIVFTIADALVSLLPGQVQAPVKKALGEIKNSFENGGLKNAIKTIGNILKNVTTVVSELAKIALPILTGALDFLGNNLKWILPLAAGLFAAFKTHQIIAAASAAMSAFAASTSASALATAASTGALTLKQLAVGVLTGQVGLATAAQWLWNAAMSANPIGAIIMLVVGLTAGLGALALSIGDCKTEDQLLSEQFAETTKAIEDETQAYKDQIDANAEKAEADLAQIDHVEKLWKELDRLADSNGEVRESDKARADFILNQLNDALGTEYKMTGNVIDNYGELKKSIADVIEAKKAEILLNAHQEDYEEAVKKIAEADKQRSDAAIEVSRQMQEKARLEKEYQQDLEKAAELYGEDSDQYKIMVAHRKEGLDQDLENVELHLAEAKKLYDTADEQYQAYYDNIQSYEEASALMLEGKSDEAVALLRRQGEAHQETAETVQGSKEEQIKALEEQAIEYETYARTLEEQYKAGVEGVSEEMVKSAREQADQALESFRKVGGNIVTGTEAGAQGKKWLLSDGMEALIDDAVQVNLKKAKDGGNEIGDEIGDGMAEGIKAAEGAVSAVTTVIIGNVLDTAKKAAEIHSPSRLFKREVGANIGKGVASGLEELGEEAESAAEEQIETLRAVYSKARLGGMMASLRGVFRQGVSGLSVVSGMNAQRASGSSAEAVPVSGGDTINNQYITFEQPMQAPDEIARELRIAQKYGLAGAR